MEGKVIPLAPAIPILYIAIDGTGVPVVPAAAIGRKGKQTEIAKTREAKLGAVFTQTDVDSDGHAVRDEDSTRMNSRRAMSKKSSPRSNG